MFCARLALNAFDPHHPFVDEQCFKFFDWLDMYSKAKETIPGDCQSCSCILLAITPLWMLTMQGVVSHDALSLVV